MKYLLLVLALVLMGASRDDCDQSRPYALGRESKDLGPLRLMLDGWRTPSRMPDAPSYWQDKRTGMCFVAFGITPVTGAWPVSCGVVEGALIKMRNEERQAAGAAP